MKPSATSAFRAKRRVASAAQKLIALGYGGMSVAEIARHLNGRIKSPVTSRKESAEVVDASNALVVLVKAGVSAVAIEAAP